MTDALRVVAHLDSLLAGDPPHLDGLMVYVGSRQASRGTIKPGEMAGYKVNSDSPCPDTSEVPIGMQKRRAAGWNVALCSSPILGNVTHDGVEHVAKRIAVEHAELLAAGERKVINTTGTWTKSYRLPLRVRRVDRVAWLCVGNRRELLKGLKAVPAVGKKTADGYGRVARWEVERIGDAPHAFWPWWEYDPDSGRPVLMRPLPLAWAGLPGDLLGARRDFGACADPYWHRDRYTEVVVPC